MNKYVEKINTIFGLVLYIKNEHNIKFNICDEAYAPISPIIFDIRNSLPIAKHIINK